jgi:hypothetical protein
MSFFINRFVANKPDSRQVTSPDGFGALFLRPVQSAPGGRRRGTRGGRRACCCPGQTGPTSPARTFVLTSARITQSSDFARSFFSSERFRLLSRIFFFKRGGRGEFRRRSCAAAARFFCLASSSRRSRASSRRSSASCLFRACERESCTVTAIPVGRCLSVTAVDTLLTCCPPGPEERAKLSSRSADEIPNRRLCSPSSIVRSGNSNCSQTSS